MLEAKKLSKTFDTVNALTNLDLAVDPGEILCLLGANGAGKTTTINLFLGFLEPTSGSATIDGLDVTTHTLEIRRRIAYIPEQVSLYRNFSGLENLAFFTALAGCRRPDEELLEILESTGLDSDQAQRRVRTYSKGMRQKVGIALAVAKRAKVLLLDEPTSGLDPKASSEFSELLRKLARDGAAVLMATHDLFRARELGNRIGIMRSGRLVDLVGTASIDHSDLETLYLSHMQSETRPGISQ